MDPIREPILRVESLTKSYDGFLAVNDVSFDVAPGELKALIGPNGAGKSTCFNMLMGQLKPTRGTVTFDGRAITGLKPRQIWRLGVGRTFQITGTYQSMSVIENVQMALISHHRRIFSVAPYAWKLYRDEAMEFLATVGMEAQADRPCSILAYGDLKRLELAIALTHRPRLLLMDEPTAGMAPSARIELMQLTADIVREQGVSVLFTEHDMDVVFAHAHHIMVLNRGQLIADGDAAAVRANPQVQEVYLGGGTLFKEADHA
ncbi:ABC transporter ATP-binding protein [Pacificitalea manganoxidans]|uniref:ABC transporter ATP-binding protein n=1 Tax=Pacificitalea manganoxidans TaxID=1411902 RepID=A0A291LZW2_9RHOB|nr:ABC transporter ATP-binding protein [Pacificitalea manganoxidans]ATI42251.1 ABC transporter ATP-binding protein [Pacificitalea manganoxidans]MDR6307931.1 branched-chain amino acid transport system ATP-binding protein [Pacificitalea manganoxidans]OWU72020.1 ABC transporter [Roseovarius sp. 22II1-1F6A]